MGFVPQPKADAGGKILEREVEKASRREPKQCVGITGCGSLGNPGLTDGNNPQRMASETDNVSAGNNWESGNKRPGSESEKKPQGEK